MIPIRDRRNGSVVTLDSEGGLLIAMRPADAAAFCAEIEKTEGFPAWIIGSVLPTSAESNERSVTLLTDAKVLEVPWTNSLVDVFARVQQLLSAARSGASASLPSTQSKGAASGCTETVVPSNPPSEPASKTSPTRSGTASPAVPLRK